MEEGEENQRQLVEKIVSLKGRLEEFERLDAEYKKAQGLQRRLSAIIEATSDFVGFADAKDKHIIYINKAGRKMVGVEGDEDVTKLKLFDVHPEWANKMFVEKIIPVVVRDGIWTGESAFLNIRDRHEIPVLMVLSSHKASNGEVEVLSTISRDITERKQADERIKKQNEFVETVINSLQYPFYVIDTDYTIILVNKAAKEKGIVEGSHCYQVTHHRQEPCTDEHVCPLKEVLRTNKPVVTEHIHFDNDGNRRNFEVHGDPILDKDGRVIQMIEYSIDITERKKAEEALKESEERFRAIFDNANDGILLADVATKKFYTGNNTACQMLGYSLEEIKNLGVTDIHPKEDLPHVMGEFEKQARREIAVAKDLPVKRKDGTVFYADVNTSSVTLGEKTYLLGIFRDVTERRQAEEELKIKISALERFQKVTVDRELKMIELKKRIADLEARTAL